jgi:hypothetical protein
MTSRFEALDYADDQALLSYTKEDMEIKVKDLETTVATVNLKIKTNSTKELCLN